MTHRCPGDDCPTCAYRIAEIEWHRNAPEPEPMRGVSLRKPIPPMSYERLMEICAGFGGAA